MSRLNELIQELCPDGVEYDLLKNISEMQRGTSLTKKNATPGNIPVVSGGREPAFYCDTNNRDEETITVAGSGAGAGYVQYWSEPIFVSDAFSVKSNEKTTTKYLYYCLEGKQDFIYSTQKGGGVPHVHISSIENLKLPVPPLEVQHEIVRILDNFTELTSELTSELTARKKQYEFYRDKLLTNEHTIVLKPLGDICTLVRGPFGGSLKKECFVSDGYAVYEQQHAIYNDFSNFRYFIDDTKFAELKRFSVNPGDMIMSCSGTMGKIAIVPDDAPKGVINQALLKITVGSEVDRKYLKYCFENTISKQMNDNARGGAIKNVASVAELKQTMIAVPPIEIQKRLVKVLDNFDAICSDLNIGLPAEIDARQKQYEFYRNLLLTFAETGIIIAQTNKQTNRQDIIRLIQYVFGFVNITLDFIAENCDSLRKPVTSGNREAGEYPYYGASGIVDYVSDYIFDGDYLLVSEDGANLLARSTPIAFSISGKNWVNNHAHVLRFETYATRRYVEFYLNSIDLSPWISGGAQPKLNQKNLNKINIPLPSLADQERIVGILDRFDAICNDLSSGLPAEIEARQKQYEYYRDKLLSFKQL